MHEGSDDEEVKKICDYFRRNEFDLKYTGYFVMY